MYYICLTLKLSMENRDILEIIERLSEILSKTELDEDTSLTIELKIKELVEKIKI